MLVPKFIKVYLNQYSNKKKFDVIFGSGAKAYKTVFEGKNSVNSNTTIIDSYVGMSTYFAGDSNLTKIKIGRFCSVGRHVETDFGLHPSNFISTHPCFYSLRKQSGFSFTQTQIFEEHKFADVEKKYLVIIGNDVWIGNDVKIMDGVTIGDGAIIAMGAIVNMDVLPYTIVGGIPSRVIKKRFSDEQIEFLSNLKWWNWEFQKIEKYAHLFNEVSSFFEFFSIIKS